jgi:cobalamin biosynthesis protein CobT
MPQEGESDPKEGDSKPGTGKENATGQAKPGEDGEPCEAEEVWVSYKDLLADDHDKVQEEGFPGDVRIVYDHDMDYESYRPSKTFKHYTKPEQVPGFDNSYRSELDARMYCDFDSRIESYKDGASGLAAAVRRLLQIRSVTRYIPNKEDGKLDSMALWKVPQGRVDVFKTRTNPAINKDTAISILGDISGSMDGGKYTALSATLELLNDCCRAVNAKYEINLFTEGMNPVYCTVKDFNAQVPESRIREWMHACRRIMSNNPDGEAVLFALRRLAARREKRKVLIVLSDGQPASTQVGDAAGHLKHVVQAASKEYCIIGVGIMSRSVEMFYENHCVIQRPSELAPVLLELIKKNVLA